MNTSENILIHLKKIKIGSSFIYFKNKYLNVSNNKVVLDKLKFMENKGLPFELFISSKISNSNFKYSRDLIVLEKHLEQSKTGVDICFHDKSTNTLKIIQVKQLTDLPENFKLNAFIKSSINKFARDANNFIESFTEITTNTLAKTQEKLDRLFEELGVSNYTINELGKNNFSYEKLEKVFVYLINDSDKQKIDINVEIEKFRGNIIICDVFSFIKKISLDYLKNRANPNINIDIRVDTNYNLNEENSKEKFNSIELKYPEPYEKQIVAFVNKKEIMLFLKEYEKKSGNIEFLFKENVRSVIQNKVSKQISETIDKEPHFFSFYNNGITIFADKITPDFTHRGIKLNNPIVINGQQTLMTIYNKFKNDNFLDEEEIEKNFNVLFRFFSSNKREIVSKVSIATNTQTKIDSIQMLRNMKHTQSLANILLDEDIFYTISDGKDNYQLNKSYFKYQMSYKHIYKYFAICLCKIVNVKNDLKAINQYVYEKLSNQEVNKFKEIDELLVESFSSEKKEKVKRIMNSVNFLTDYFKTLSFSRVAPTDYQHFLDYFILVLYTSFNNNNFTNIKINKLIKRSFKVEKVEQIILYVKETDEYKKLTSLNTILKNKTFATKLKVKMEDAVCNANSYELSIKENKEKIKSFIWEDKFFSIFFDSFSKKK